MTNQMITQQQEEYLMEKINMNNGKPTLLGILCGIVVIGLIISLIYLI
jgi:molybdopterin biosynthesis enzyme